MVHIPKFEFRWWTSQHTARLEVLWTYSFLHFSPAWTPHVVLNCLLESLNTGKQIGKQNRPVKSPINTNNHLKSTAYTLITPLWAHEQMNICSPWMKKHLRDYFSTHRVIWGITLQWKRRTVSISFSLHKSLLLHLRCLFKQTVVSQAATGTRRETKLCFKVLSDHAQRI